MIDNGPPRGAMAPAVATLATLVMLSASPARAQTEPEPAAETPKVAPAFGRWRLFPGGDVYEVYLADPHRPTNGLCVQFYGDVTVSDSSDIRTWLAGGGRFGMVRLGPRPGGSRYWQLSIEAGLDAQYDSYRRLDNVGYDGNYGLTLTTASAGPLAWKLAMLHISAHIGDEYANRTGRERLGYTREEVALGLAVRLGHGFRVYGEGGYAYKRLNEELLRPGRLQGGIERAAPRAFAKGRLGWYAALDLQSWEERDWRIDVSLEAGLMVRSAGRTWRAGVRYVNGRVPLGEFFQHTESWITLGLWMDL